MCMWHVCGRGEVLVGNLREKDHLEDVGIDGKIIFQWILKEKMVA